MRNKGITLSNLFGMLSGPTPSFSDDKDRSTSSLETKSSSSTRLRRESRVRGVKWSVRLTKKSLIAIYINVLFEKTASFRYIMHG